MGTSIEGLRDVVDVRPPRMVAHVRAPRRARARRTRGRRRNV